MTRPQIEFIQAQLLPWAKGHAASGRIDVEVKTLSGDPESGAESLIIRYPPGWTREKPEYLATDEEFFVLDGEIEINSRLYGPDTYANLPRGFLREQVTTPSGAVLITFFASAPTVHRSPPPAGLYRPEKLVGYVCAYEGEWKVNADAMGLSTEMRTLARYRILREDPETQEMTYMVATLPYKTEASPETHPVVQEFYVLAGEIAGNVGVMQTGAYVWRPEDIPHGPYCNKTGALFLMRTLGGPLTTVHLDPVPYSFDTPYRPVLPPELAPLGAKPRPRTPRY